MRVKGLTLRLDVLTHRRLQRALLKTNLGFQTVARSLMLAWIEAVETDRPVDIPASVGAIALLSKPRPAKSSLVWKG